ncbi:MAG TPA: hypothetical protein VFL97_01825, partial [Nitrococcus sp.]|nr:hypothetical protein [Nitrococcus sp.]
MTALHQYQSQVSPLRRRPAPVFSSRPVSVATYSGAVSSCPPQLLGYRDPIASRAFFFLSRKLSLPGLLAHIQCQAL